MEEREQALPAARLAARHAAAADDLDRLGRPDGSVVASATAAAGTGRQWRAAARRHRLRPLGPPAGVSKCNAAGRGNPSRRAAAGGRAARQPDGPKMQACISHPQPWRPCRQRPIPMTPACGRPRWSKPWAPACRGPTRWRRCSPSSARRRPAAPAAVRRGRGADPGGRRRYARLANRPAARSGERRARAVLKRLSCRTRGRCLRLRRIADARCSRVRASARGRGRTTGRASNATPHPSGRVPCDARLRGPVQNSLRELRSLRSDSCDESAHEARCARGRESCASRRRFRSPASGARGLSSVVVRDGERPSCGAWVARANHRGAPSSARADTRSQVTALYRLQTKADSASIADRHQTCSQPRKPCAA